ncbi:MAG: glycosyltransferase [Casimicrobiaceae bacterium]|nr:glycosyltransferase [Casimicrobiaceae bacterium]MDW8311747.1 glycosyltransferase [Burkholderiales bacterium]
MQAAPSRNAPCPCGSGRRYKECHGRLDAAAAPLPTKAQTLAEQALAAQQARRLEQAERLYREALTLDPNHADALHMLGVVRLERGDALEALTLILRATELTDWRYPAFLHNLGLALARCLSGDEPVEHLLGEVGRRYRTEGVQGSLREPRAVGLVSVLVPSFNHGRFIEQAIESVFAQTWRELELVVIDDGSRDDSPERLRALERRSPIPFRLVLRENRGAAATLNEAARLARGQWLHPVNSDDVLPPERIERMVEAVAARGHDWGFGRVECLDAQGRPIDPLADPRVFAFYGMQSEIGLAETVSECFLTANVAISTGNLFFSRALFERIGGFREDERWHHDWSFALAACFEAEPQYVPTATYRYRLHETNTISEAAAARLAEVARLLPPFFERVFAGGAPNPWAPDARRWGAGLVARLLSSGAGRYVPRERIQALAREVLARLGENV